MKIHSAVVIAGVLGAACAGCMSGVTAPTAPGGSTAAQQPASAAPRLATVDARVEGSALIVDVRTNHPLLDVRAHDLQVFVDADDNPATGYGAHGDEYVARLLESRDAVSFPLRHTEPVDPTDPAGWGTVSGTGRVGYGAFALLLRIPVAAIGGAGGPVRVRVELYADGAFDYRDVTANPTLAAIE